MKKRVVKAAALGGLVVILALCLGACPQPTDNGPSAQEQADDFKAAQTAVLGKTVDTITIGDEAAVDAALAAWGALSDDVKAQAAAEKTKLDTLKQRIAELKAADNNSNNNNDNDNDGDDNDNNNNDNDDDNDNDDTPAFGPVTGLGGTAGNGEVTLTWSDPAELDHVEITWDPNGFEPVPVAKGLETYTATGLTNNTWYTFTLRAVAADGTKSEPAAITRVPASLGLTAYPGKTQVLVRWTDPNYAGFDHVEITWAGGSMTVPAGRQFAAASPLSTDTEYTITVDTVNTAGEKGGGQSVTATTDSGAWNWRPALSPVPPVGTNGIAGLTYSEYNGGIFLMAFQSGIYTSPDGETWAGPADSGLGSNVSSIASNADGSVLVAGGSGGKISRSVNGGQSWTPVGDSSFGTSTINGVRFLNGKFAAYGADGKIAWSDTGETWTQVTDTQFGNNNIIGMAYGNNTYIAVGGKFSGTVRMTISSDGQTWTVKDDGYYITENTSLSDIVYDANTFVAVGGYGVLYSTDNGGTWVHGTLPVGVSNSLLLRAVTWGGGQFIALNNFNNMFSSPDGQSWDRITGAAGAFMASDGGIVSLGKPAYGKGIYVIGASYGIIAYGTGD
jgi:hypothetical protein